MKENGYSRKNDSAIDAGPIPGRRRPKRRRTMRRILFVSMFVLVSMCVSLLAAKDEEKSMQKILSGIRATQNVKTDMEIDADRATNEQLESLGGVIMNMLNPTPKMRDMMDYTMGGADLPAMKGARRMLGYRYLNCGPASMMGFSALGNGPMCPAMISQGMMAGSSGGHSMMHGRHFWVAAFIFTWLVIIILVLLVIILAKKAFCGKARIDIEK